MKPVIIDCGSGYTKMGLAGSTSPSHVIPTVLYRSDRAESVDFSIRGILPLSTSLASSPVVSIGNSAIKHSVSDARGFTKPILDGRVSDWTDLEYFIQNCYSQYLKIDSSERPVILTEPPLNPAINRERLAETMFETFNVPSMYIGVQAVLALYAYWDGKSAMTGTVVDSGDGLTHVIPVTEGYVGAAKELGIAGKDVTKLIYDSLVMRGEVEINSPESAVAVGRLAKEIKESLSYVCADPVKEFSRFDSDLSLFRKIEWTDPRVGKATDCAVGYERFLGPEIFFQPSLVGGNTSLQSLVVDTVQACPIDYRRGLFSNIVLSGGSTMFPNFATRLQHEVGQLVKGSVKVAGNVEVQRFAVWNGASVLAGTENFEKSLVTRKEYEEYGPRVARDTTITRCIGL